MYCKRCGKEAPPNRAICLYCGRSLSDNQNFIKPIGDASSFGWAILGFLIPLVGLILYLV